jgi:hypothetical protein
MMTPRTIVRTDSLFETALGLVLVSGSLGASDFPDPVGKPLIVAFGAALVAVGVLLWRLADTVDLRTLATANLATAALAVAWCVAGKGFSPAGTALAIATAAALVVLAAAQLLSSRG